MLAALPRRDAEAGVERPAAVRQLVRRTAMGGAPRPDRPLRRPKLDQSVPRAQGPVIASVMPGV